MTADDGKMTARVDLRPWSLGDDLKAAVVTNRRKIVPRTRGVHMRRFMRSDRDPTDDFGAQVARPTRRSPFWRRSRRQARPLSPIARRHDTCEAPQ